MIVRHSSACGDQEEELRQKLDVLRGHCEAVGRPYEEIERTALNTVRLAAGGDTPASVIEQCRGLAKLGFQQLIFNMPNVEELAPLETFGREIIPAVAEL